MAGKPTPFKVLECFKDGKEVSEREIFEAIEGEQESVRNALNKFVERGIVIELDGLYRPGPKFDPVFKRMLETYEAVRNRPERGNIIRGLLNLLPRFHLISMDFVLRMAHEAGFNEEEIKDFLNDEAERGLIGRVRVVSNRELPIFISRTWRMRTLGRSEIERPKKAWTSNGLKVTESI